MSNGRIRAAQIEDLDSIQKLAVQLGYNPTKETILTGLRELQANGDYEVVVITEADLVVGWMTLCVRHRLEDIPFLQVAAIVTEETRRGSGLGKKLMNYAENRAKEKGLPFVGLHSSKRRSDAHRFYEKTGYEKANESFFFRKTLT